MANVLIRSVVVVLCSAVLALNTYAAVTTCGNKCNTGDCWKIDQDCWKVDQITCCDWGSWAKQSGGVKQLQGAALMAKSYDAASCTAECPGKNNPKGQADSRASLKQAGTTATGMTMRIDNCSCNTE